MLAGHIVEYPSTETLSEATAGGGEVEAVTYPLCRDLVDRWEVVTEEDIRWGMKYIWDVHQERVEGAGQKVVVGQPAGCGGKLGQGRDLLHSLPAAHFLPIRTHQGSTL